MRPQHVIAVHTNWSGLGFGNGGLVRGQLLLLLEANETQRLSTESGLIDGAAADSAPDPTQLTTAGKQTRPYTRQQIG